MSRKSVLGAVCVANGALEATARRIVNQQHRSFTSTPQRSANIAHFTPTSSPQLDALLNDIRYKIILPSYLPRVQRKKIYSSKWAKRLQADPITIEIDDEVIKFRWQNPMTDIPDTTNSLTAAIRQFETSSDFINLKPLFEGILHSRRKLSDDFYSKIIRIIGFKGRIYDIISCARNVRTTGYALNTSEKVMEALHFVQLKAIDADWDEAKTRKALRQAEIIIEMLHEKAHQPKRLKNDPLVPGELAMYRDPMVLLAPLHLAAVLAARHDAGEELLDNVHKLARDVVTVWPKDKKLKEVQPAELYADPTKMGYLNQPNKYLAMATPLLHGLETAIKVVKPELAGQLQTRRDTLVVEIQEARNAIAPQEIRGINVYKKFYGA